MDHTTNYIDLNYNIRFYGYWHCGSGLTAGADADATVIKDIGGLPFIPGKTMKGLIKEAVEELLFLEKKWDLYRNQFIDVFGNAEDRDYLSEDKTHEKKEIRGNAFFSNAELPDIMKKNILEEELQKGLYTQLAYTAIDDGGIAEENSLRLFEVVVPVTLSGCILHIPNDFQMTLCKGMKMIKRIGINRSRGLGRCDIILKNE